MRHAPPTPPRLVACGLLAALAAVVPAAAQSLTAADGTLDGDHPAVAVLADPSYALLAAALAAEPGFAGLAPDLDGTPRLVALFEGPVPPALPTELVPAGWALEAYGGIRYERLELVVDDAEVPLEHGAPLPEDSLGIGPGSTLLVNFFDPVENGNFIGICTAAFVFRDRASGRLFLGAAGHCFMGTTFTSTHGDDADWDPANTTRVRACVGNCIGGGSGLLSGALGVYPGTTRDLGVESKVHYARQTIAGADVGNDFGIVEIPAELCPEIRTDMPVWNGPATSDTARRVQTGDLIAHYGNAVALGEVFPEKGRAGLGMGANESRWLARLASFQGDSGSAVNIALASAEDLVEGEWAAGVLTHIIITPDTGAIAGTNASRAIEMARQEVGLDLEIVHDATGLCDGGEPPVVTAVDDADPAVEYRKGWHRRSDADASAGGFHRRLGPAGGGEAPSVRLVFSGHEVSYRYAVSDQGGHADLFLDGAFAATVDYSGAAPASDPEFGRSLTFGDLEEGVHELRLELHDGAAYVDGFEIVSAAGGGADAAAAGTSSSTAVSNGSPLGVGSTILVETVTAGPDDEWLSVVVESASRPVSVALLDPLGALAATGAELVSGASAVGLDLDPALAGIYTVQVTGGLAAAPEVEISIARETTVE